MSNVGKQIAHEACLIILECLKGREPDIKTIREQVALIKRESVNHED